jgi:hypothetical protein
MPVHFPLMEAHALLHCPASRAMATTFLQSVSPPGGGGGGGADGGALVQEAQLIFLSRILSGGTTAPTVSVVQESSIPSS